MLLNHNTKEEKEGLEPKRVREGGVPVFYYYNYITRLLNYY
jgi:hypothetical protein